MGDNGLDIIAFDEFEQFKARRIQQVITGHCLMNDIEDETKRVVVC